MKKFVNPEIEFIKFSAEDVITTSVDGGDILLSTKVETDAAENSPATSFDWTNMQWYQ